MSEVFACRDADRSYDLILDDEGVSVDGSRLAWLDVDDLRYDRHAIGFVLPDASVHWANGLGARLDECAAKVRALRGEARRPALTQTALAPVAQFDSVTVVDGTPSHSDVLLFPHVLTIEPRSGPTTVIPLPLVRDVVRAGHTFTLACRGVPSVEVRGLGARTDEFAMRLSECRVALAASTRAAFAALDPDLGALDAPDGWSVDAESAGTRWDLLKRTWLARARGRELDVLTGLVGDSGLRLGLWTEGGTVTMPFALAVKPAGHGWRVAVEAVDADDRATFAFDVDDVDRLNAALILTAFRREALSLPDAELGRWATAVRTQPTVAWARAALIARVVHDDRWEASVRELLA